MNYIILILSVVSLCQILPASAFDTKKISKRSNSIEWKNCNDNAPVKIQSLSITPNPIPLRGTVTVSACADVESSIEGPVNVNIEIYRKILFWISVKTIIINDLCEKFPSRCPETVKENELPCKCPIEANSYSLPPVTFEMPDIPVADFLVKGNYKVIVKGSQFGSQLFCYTIYFSID
ncbi:ganglioside GM2 activator-like isoform X2 [Centruroides vittatus]|uniref:ganglioside GM2 activator-like isoform X2 n=1 Tax=Centruroides vittatus TaxID=120091 RepID=UPI00350EC514